MGQPQPTDIFGIKVGATQGAAETGTAYSVRWSEMVAAMGTNYATTAQGTSADTAFGWGNHASAGYLASQTSHADVVVDGDFASNGILKRTASGVYGIVTDNSANWNTAFGWGNHASAGYLDDGALYATAAQGVLAVTAVQPAVLTAALADLVDSSPAALNTLNELAAALGDDPNFATTVTNSIGLKANIASPAFTGTPTGPTAVTSTDTIQLATTAFVQQEIAALGAIDVSASINATVTKIFVDNLDVDAATLNGISSTGFATAAHFHDASIINTGVIAAARLGSGTADGTTFLRGDNVWAAPAGGGGGGGGDLFAANNLIDVENVPTARQNLGLEIGVDVQAYDAGISTLLGITITPFAESILDDADATTVLATIGGATAAQGALADTALQSETSHADVLVDGDFATNGLMKRTADGVYTIVTDNSGNWNTAFAFGDHAAAGYLTNAAAFATTAQGALADTALQSYTETSHTDVVVDGDFASNGILKRTALGTYGIVTDNSSNWDTAYSWGDHASAGYLDDGALYATAAQGALADTALQTVTSHTHDAGDITSGLVSTARLGTGTASGTTYLRGDGTWNTPAGGGVSALELKTADFTWTALGPRALVDTSGGVITGTLPFSPSVGDRCYFNDVVDFSINIFTVARNGELIEGLSEDLTVSTKNTSGGFSFVGGSIGWKAIKS